MTTLRRWWAKVPAFYRDLTERAAKTFAQVFALTLIGSGVDFAHLPTLPIWQKALAAGAGAGLSVFTSWLSSLRGDHDSASALKNATPIDTTATEATNPPVLGGQVAEQNATPAIATTETPAPPGLDQQGALAADLDHQLRP